MATIEKAEIKILTANNIGADIEDMLEQAKKAEHMHEGGKIALADAAKKVNALTELFVRSVKEGEIDLSKNMEPEQIEGLVKRWINRCVGLLENLMLVSQNAQLSSAGMVAAYKNAMKAPMKVMEAERKKMEAVKAAIEEQQKTGDPDLDIRTIARAVGEHPGDPLADRRKPNGASNGASEVHEEKPAEPDLSKLSPARKELVTQIDASLALLAKDNPDAEILGAYRKFIVEGGDLRTKDGRELREQAESLLKAKNPRRKG